MKHKRILSFNEIQLKPNEPVSTSVLNQLKKINAQYTEKKDFSQYLRSIEALFHLNPLNNVTNDTYFYLSGFFEGEASLYVSAKKNQTSRLKFYFLSGFNLTQHINGISNLHLAMQVFQTGRIRYKVGSLATFVYTIDNRQALQEKVIPFYEKYVFCYCSQSKMERTQKFKRFLQLLKEKAHLNFDRTIHELLPLWFELRAQFHSNQTFKTLLEAQNYIEKNIVKE